MRIFIILFILLFANFSYSRTLGETEITAEEGIEVFQEDKYYLLKKNVKIESDKFVLLGDEIKIFFNKDLYDIQLINAFGNVSLISDQFNVSAEGNKLFFQIENEEIIIEGKSSKLITDEIKMFSNGKIQVINLNGNFNLIGPNSILKSQDILIEGSKIDGTFSSINNSKEIIILNVYDQDIAYIKSDNTEMFAKNIKYNKELSLIELEEDVKIIRGGEVIMGDYGTLDTKTNSYKIKSNDSNKVKAILKNNNE
tara:strand:+ start:1469 stop:2230 length:762 start_codon:yes stop_codon:yes gene_type:complete